MYLASQDRTSMRKCSFSPRPATVPLGLLLVQRELRHQLSRSIPTISHFHCFANSNMEMKGSEILCNLVAKLTKV